MRQTGWRKIEEKDGDNEGEVDKMEKEDGKAEGVNKEDKEEMEKHKKDYASVKIEKNEIIFLFSGSGRSSTQDGRLWIAHTR